MSASRPLKLQFDNAIIGGGLSGIVAALRMSGTTILLSKGLGSTAISSGAIIPSGKHDGSAEKWFLEAMSDTSCPYKRGTAKTDMGAIRTGIIPSVTAFEGEPFLVQPDKACFTGCSCQETAKLVESSETALDGLIRYLSDIKAESVLIPPILGITTVVERRAYLENAIGAKAYEYLTAPSVHGLRLVMSLKDKAGRKNGLTLMDMVTIGRLHDGILHGHMGTKGKRLIEVEAGNVVIATGGILTGFKVEGDRVYEPLTGRIVSDVIDVNSSFFTDHALMHKGIGAGPFVIKGFKDTRAIGASAEGYGLYRSLVTGYNAGGLI